MKPGKKQFIQLLRHPVKFRWFMLSKLPSAFFSGVRLKSIDEQSAVVTVPYKWFSQNPFRSTYFACLAMAAEMSTGLLALVHTQSREPSIALLVTGLEATYFKKATGITMFTCEAGDTIRAVIEEAAVSGEPGSVRARSTGLNMDGELVAEFFITWSFKRRS